MPANTTEEVSILREKEINEVGDLIFNVDLFTYDEIDNDLDGDLIGYARVSTGEQNLDTQIETLKSEGCKKIFRDKQSALSDERDGLKEALKYLRPGDTLVVYRLDRLGRLVGQLVLIGSELCRRGIGLKSVSDGIDCNLHTPQGGMMYHVLCALAQNERDVTHARTMEGLRQARAQGRTGGQQPSVDNDTVVEIAKKRRSPDWSSSDLQERYGVSAPTLSRYTSPEGTIRKLPFPEEASLSWLKEHREFFEESMYDALLRASESG